MNYMTFIATIIFTVSLGFIFLHAVTLHFSIKITSRGRRRNIRRLVYLIYLPSFYFVYKSWTPELVSSDILNSIDEYSGYSLVVN